MDKKSIGTDFQQKLPFYKENLYKLLFDDAKVANVYRI